MGPEILQKLDAMDNLRDRLRECAMIARYGPEEPATLVHAFSDIEESCRRFLGELLPRLADPEVKGAQLEDLLVDIEEEFRHIVYHVHDPHFFRAVEPTHDWLCVPGRTA